jgi:hypothetical protein
VTRRVALLGVVAVLLAAGLAGCGGGGDETPTVTTPAAKVSVRLYFLLDGKVQGVDRNVPKATVPASEAFGALLEGPTAREQALGLSSAMPSGADWTVTVGSDGTPVLETGKLSRAALAQTVYTLTQFPGSRTVEVNGTRYTRAGFEDETPSILVESPLPFRRVTSPLHARGTANTFEATFQYDLVGPDGKVLKTHFVTATSGTGTRGTFAFDVPFTAQGSGKLVVYELSAKDGSRIHQVEIPLLLAG